MNYLLDVNVLVAWGWSDHVDHQRVDAWIAKAMKSPNDKWMTSAIPELGFVRVSVQRSGGRLTPSQASAVLDGMVAVLGKRYGFLPDDQPARLWPAWCQGASRTTDAHLLALANAHHATLTTLDRGIPSAFLVP